MFRQPVRRRPAFMPVDGNAVVLVEKAIDDLINQFIDKQALAPRRLQHFIAIWHDLIRAIPTAPARTRPNLRELVEIMAIVVALRGDWTDRMASRGAPLGSVLSDRGHDLAPKAAKGRGTFAVAVSGPQIAPFAGTCYDPLW